jgi:hypothetical protein
MRIGLLNFACLLAGPTKLFHEFIIIPMRATCPAILVGLNEDKFVIKDTGEC